MNSKAWYCAAVAFCLGLLACQSDSEVPEGSSTEVVFRVVNYTQYSLDEVTRAAGTEPLSNLALGVFDAETDAPVGTMIIQNKDDKDYGTFSIRLTRGQYRLVFLGYTSKNECSMTTPSAVSFEKGVPNTFLYSTILTVGEDPVPVQNIVLKRAVGAFQLTLTDAIPSELAKLTLKFSGGSTTLNAKTGFAADNAGRTYSTDVESKYIGETGVTLTVFLFIPEGEAPMDITVDALNSKGEVIHSRKFPAVPMKVNQLLNYTGEFFADPTSELSATVTYDIKWGSEQTVNF